MDSRRRIEMKSLGGCGVVALVVLAGCGGPDSDDPVSDNGALSAGGAAGSSEIPEKQLTPGVQRKVVPGLLNCRKDPGTSSPTVIQYRSGDIIKVMPPEDKLMTARTPDHQLWVLVSKPGQQPPPC